MATTFGLAMHLLRRWWGSLWAGAPPAEVEVWVENWLTPGERALWRRLDDRDRSHAVTVARRYLTRRPDAPRAEVAAALLHDCGKIESGLGTWGRVAATVVGPRIERFRRYADHERLGAALLRTAGSDPLTVALVARSGDAPRDALSALAAADAR